MALTCDECGYENLDDALMCNMCQKVFRKEPSGRATRSQPRSATANTAARRMAPAAQTASAPSNRASASKLPSLTAQTAARGTPPAVQATSASLSTAPAPRPKTIEGLDAMGWHERGLECLKNQQGKAALECYEKALAIEPRFTKAWGNKATLLHISGRNEDALRAIEAALRIDPLYMSCWYTKSIIEYSTKQYPQAMRSFNEVLTFPINVEQDMIQNAQNAMQAMQKGGVQAVERDALGWAAEGTLRGRQGQFARGVPCFDKAIELDSGLAVAWHYKSCALMRLDRLEDALVCDEKAIELDAENPEHWHQKGLTLKGLRRFEEALASYDRALEIEERNPAYWSDRGLVLGNLNRHEDSISSLEKAIALAPDAAAPWLNKALSEETLNRDQDAVKSYQRFVELASPDLQSHIQHANLRIAALKAKVDAAATPVPAAPGTPPSGGGAEASMIAAGPVTGEGEQDFCERARSFEQAGQYEEAIDCLDQALAMGCRPSPSPQPSPQRGEGETEGSQHRHEADAWYIRGCCLQQLGELEEAIASLDRSLELGPNQPEAWYHKGVSEQLSNSDIEAARSFEKFLSFASPENHGALIEDARHRQKKLSAGTPAASD